MQCTRLVVRHDGALAYVTLARPEVRNAFDATMIAELTAAFEELGRDVEIRAIVLEGEGSAFCGGADINWMRASLDLDEEANREDARALSRMFRTIDRVPKAVVARVHGAALGGGAGLVAVCDIAIASADTRFGFTETKLGILPAVISPFVLAKIGTSHARALALTGERFDAARAMHVGLVHEVVASEPETASPTAIAATKALFAHVAASTYDDTLEMTARAIAAQRTSAEGQDGLRAFLEKRSPAWVR